MVKGEESKKRKASVPESGAEKMKKLKKLPAEAVLEKKRKATDEAAPVAVKKSKKPKPTLENASSLQKPITTKEAKPNKNTNGDTAKKIKSAAKKPKPAKESKEQDLIESSSDVEDANEEIEGEGEDSEIDDQTDALLKGFESDGEDSEDEGGLKEGEEVPKVPEMSNRSKKQLDRAMTFKKDDKPGVVYIGHIPRGFFEHEMSDYFKQFGTITKLRLSRNRYSGSSKGYAFIEFESSAVAEIVAKTMDNYLLFNHILKVKLVPNEQIPAKLWQGANRRFKKVPWNKIAGRQLKQPKSEGAWEKQNERIQARRKEKADELKAIGYEYEAPELKSAKGLAPKAQPALNNADDEVKAIEAIPTEKEELVRLKKKAKKEKKQASKVAQEEGSVIDAAVDLLDSVIAPAEGVEQSVKIKKSKVVVEATEGGETAEAAEKPLKVKKSKIVIEAIEGGETAEAKVKKPKKSKKVKPDA